MSKGQYIVGKNSVLAVLKSDPERVFKVFVAEGLKPDKRIDAIYQEARESNIAVQRVPRQKLDGMVGDPEAHHQGVLASVAPKALLSIEELLAKARQKMEAGAFPLVLVLDEVTDPRNFGAILRVCDAAGVDGVVVAKHHSAGFGPAVAKTASGAEATVDVAVVSNLGQALDKLKDGGFWIVGAANTKEAVPYYQQDYKMATVLVMGSEEKGLSRLVAQRCDFQVRIPMHGSVDSLNVATAAAVLVFDILSRR
jgi:23S rRNA (guanosine2251-2'-O)-methyltransferase